MKSATKQPAAHQFGAIQSKKQLISLRVSKKIEKNSFGTLGPLPGDDTAYQTRSNYQRIDTIEQSSA
jgi:hypothetical protein